MSKKANETNEKKVFSRKLALELGRRGFNIVRTEQNRFQPALKVYIFEDSDELQKTWTHLSKLLRENGKFSDKSNLRYVYDPRQNDFFQKNKARPIFTDMNIVSDRRYWIYDFDSTKTLFANWCRSGNR